MRGFVVGCNTNNAQDGIFYLNIHACTVGKEIVIPRGCHHLLFDEDTTHVTIPHDYALVITEEVEGFYRKMILMDGLA